MGKTKTTPEERVVFERDQLRGEVVALREALDTMVKVGGGTLQRRWQSVWTQEDYEDFAKALASADTAALTATPRAAKLGTLIEAALAVADAQIHYRQLESEEHFRRLNVLVAAADAVLASEEGEPNDLP